ncbi:MAG: oligosaccharide flippase family protein [Cytophagaceae bacterium]|nr:oligosaccharide flippase family protein [Gemmatimonadaceae bacterium]
MNGADPEALSLGGLIRRARARLSGGGVGASMTRGALVSLVIQVAGAGLSFVGQIVLSRSLGQEAFGVYLVALAAMNAAQVLGRLELDAAATRFIGAYMATQRWELARGFVRWSRLTMTKASLAVVTVGAIIVVIAYDRLATKHPQLPGALLAACVLLPFNARLILNGAYLQGLKHYAEALVAGTIVRPLLLMLVLGTAWLGFGKHFSATTGVLVNAGAATASLGLTWFFLRRLWPQPMQVAEPAYEKSAWWKAVSGMIVVGVSQMVVSQTIDLIVIGTFLSTSESALYGAASSLTLLLNFGQMSVNFVAAPMIADFHARGRTHELQRMVRLVMAASAIVTVPVLLGLVLFGHSILRLYGPTFDAAYPVLMVLAAASAWVSLVGSLAGFLLTMTDYQRDAARIIGASAALNLVLTLFLTPMFGMLGTATATLIATVARGLGLAIFIRRRMGLRLI